MHSVGLLLQPLLFFLDSMHLALTAQSLLEARLLLTTSLSAPCLLLLLLLLLPRLLLGLQLRFSRG
jgi:hypothetical protein